MLNKYFGVVKTYNKKAVKIFGLSIFKIKKHNFKIKYYLFGIKLFTKFNFATLMQEVINAKHEISTTKQEVINIKHEIANTTQEVINAKHEISTTTQEVLNIKHEIATTTQEVLNIKHELVTTKQEVINAKHELINILLYSTIQQSNLSPADKQKAINCFNSAYNQLQQDNNLWLQYINIALQQIQNYNPNNADSFLLFDNLFDNNAECIDTYSMFLYLQQNNIPAKYIINVNNKLYNDIKDNPNVIGVTGTIDFITTHANYIATANNIITSFGFFNNTNKLFKNLPFSNYIFTTHGSIYLKNSTNIFYTNTHFNSICAVLQQNIDFFKNNMGWQDNEILKNGLPRWDLLKKEPQNNKNILVFFTWRFAFHSNPHNITNYLQNIVNFCNNTKLQTLLQQNNIQLNLSIHHEALRIMQEHNIAMPNLPKNVNLVSSLQVSTYIKTADLLITDYSSIVFDFMFLNTPVIFYRFDANADYLNNTDKEDLEYAKSLDHTLYNCFYTEQETINKIEHYINNNFILEDDYKKINNSFFWQKENIRETFYNQIKNINKL